MDITELQEPLYRTVSGKAYGHDFFSNGEKRRVSLIFEQLEGLTVKEAQDLLGKISEALPRAVTVSLREQE